MTHTLAMNMSSEQFKCITGRIKYEKHVLFNNVLIMRHREFGLVSIVDQLPPNGRLANINFTHHTYFLAYIIFIQITQQE